jgi:hypothetical protein
MVIDKKWLLMAGSIGGAVFACQGILCMNIGIPRVVGRYGGKIWKDMGSNLYP